MGSFDANSTPSLNGSNCQGETPSQALNISNYSHKDIENMVSELRLLKAENKELLVHKYSKNVSTAGYLI